MAAQRTLPRQHLGAGAVVFGCLVGVPIGVAVAVSAVAEVIARWAS
jgi:hypothetical protein